MPARARTPAFVFPAGACDAHCHVWGPIARFPFATQRPYTPPERDKHVLSALHARFGIDRTVFVQPIVHGTDNRAMLDAVAEAPWRHRGIALIDAGVSEAELLRLHEAGIRGIRFAFVRHLGARPDLAAFQRSIEKVRPFGWHVVLHVDARDLPELSAIVARLPVPFVIDHMGRIDAAGGTDQPAFAALLALAARETCWIKLSGADRVSASGTPFLDAVPFARALIAAAPERVIWGTDFPHPVPRHSVKDEAELVDLLPCFAEEAALYRLLVTNPARLYGFVA